MTITATTLVDDGFKVITDTKGIGNETKQLVVDVDTLLNATADAKVSIANLVYDIKGTGKVKLFFNDEEVLEIDGRGNYGLKPNEEKLSKIGDVKLSTDANVNTYNIVFECHKETGFN
jgi:hypothetical protein